MNILEAAQVLSAERERVAVETSQGVLALDGVVYCERDDSLIIRTRSMSEVPSISTFDLLREVYDQGRDGPLSSDLLDRIAGLILDHPVQGANK